MKQWLLVGAVLLAGCATHSSVSDADREKWKQGAQAHHDKVEADLSSWNGHDISDVILQRGNPTGVSTLPNGSQLYTWDSATLPCVIRFAVDPNTHRITGHSFGGC